MYYSEHFSHCMEIVHLSPVPKVDNPKECDDYRPITIIPVLPKVYERSTTSILMHFRDEIIQAMKKG